MLTGRRHRMSFLGNDDDVMGRLRVDVPEGKAEVVVVHDVVAEAAVQAPLVQPHGRHGRGAAPPLFPAAVGRGDDSRVVLYSRGSVMWATRVWWMLRAIGFDNASVLDGGWEKWCLDGRPTRQTRCRHPRAALTVKARSEVFVGKATMEAAIGDSRVCTVNALSRNLHRGKSANYGRRGRIPGSVNVPYSILVDSENHTFLDAASVAASFHEVGADADKRCLVYCGGGIAASLDAFLMYQLGYEDVAIYDASMSEWARDPSLPMETG